MTCHFCFHSLFGTLPLEISYLFLLICDTTCNLYPQNIIDVFSMLPMFPGYLGGSSFSFNGCDKCQNPIDPTYQLVKGTT